MAGEREGLLNNVYHQYLHHKAHLLIIDNVANIEKEKNEIIITCISMKFSVFLKYKPIVIFR